MSSEEKPVDVVLIHRNPPCKKCLKTKAAIEHAIAEATRPAALREIYTGTPEAAPYGAVFSPMVLINGEVVSAGLVPAKAGLVILINGAGS